MDFFYKDIQKNEKSYHIILYDASGKYIYRNIINVYTKESHGCIVMSDATKKQRREK